MRAMARTGLSGACLLMEPIQDVACPQPGSVVGAINGVAAAGWALRLKGQECATAAGVLGLF